MTFEHAGTPRYCVVLVSPLSNTDPYWPRWGDRALRPLPQTSDRYEILGFREIQSSEVTFAEVADRRDDGSSGST